MPRYARVGDMNRTPAQRLGELVREQRERVGIYHIVDGATKAGVSRETWAKLERGDSVSRATYRKIEDALQWEHGSCEATLGGGEPTIREANTHAPAVTGNPYTDPLEREIWNLTALPEDERRAYIELMRERRRAAG